ncbi:macro domain-containing protein [Thalassobacter stenotrophicus]|uniref:type II toxin-antitoxin system antitoxin DNA ADP-ribosyl glycohydrolase DarG n=1 Tax=Thalassobacter stenotrophicus TaxID=266809 RepID=UPI0022A99CA7|nr:macro domain-containing protein [Thalassobacter stenotrophicus]UYP67839.1 macro domain-containing protein [Thalassobacter stenotrophicus]
MIRFTSGDILQSEADALVNTVNCVGVMGRGIALQFKKAFPKNFEEYKLACDRGNVVPGRMFITERNALTAPKFIVNFPTKRHWRGKSRMEDIESGLQALKEQIDELGIKSIAIPPLGSGLGGLSWPDVRAMIESSLSDVDAEVIVFEPGEAPDAAVMARSTEPPNMTPGRATLVTLMHRYLGGLLDPFVTLIELHKLMYFMQEAGEPLRLKYKKHHYGPYAENLRHVLNQIEGHLVSGYADGGDIPGKQLELVPGAVSEAEEFLLMNNETHERFERVSRLVEGFESPVGLELLATVHWLIQNEDVTSAEEAVEKTYAWNERKRRFTPRQITLAFNRLTSCGWERPVTAQ